MQQQPNNSCVLPSSPAAAVQQMIRISQSLVTLAEKETQALLTNDMLAFSIIQYEKEKMTGNYTKSSEAFRNRIEEFRLVETNLLNRLEQLQKDLAEKTNDNNTLVEQMRQRSQVKTQKGIATVREMAQQRHVRFNGGTKQAKNSSIESVKGA